MGGERILGIDGGGTKILLALADRDGRIIRTARGGGVNPMDNSGWTKELQSQLAGFADEAGLAAIGAALPAYGEVAATSALQRQAVAEVFGSLPQTVLNDVDAAHIGAFAGGAGVLLLSGTGSMAWARDAEGRSHRVGGWGEVVGDEGSSYWIGRLALNAISQSLDGRGPETSLFEAVFSSLELDPSEPMNALENWASHLGLHRAGIAKLAVIVDQEADRGDRVAMSLIERTAEELAKHFTAIVPRCAPDADWTYAGGTFGSRALLNAVTARVGKPPVPPRLPPVGGALLAAAQSLGWPVTSAFVEQIAAATSAANGTANEKKAPNV